MIIFILKMIRVSSDLHTFGLSRFKGRTKGQTLQKTRLLSYMLQFVRLVHCSAYLYISDGSWMGGIGEFEFDRRPEK